MWWMGGLDLVLGQDDVDVASANEATRPQQKDRGGQARNCALQVLLFVSLKAIWWKKHPASVVQNVFFISSGLSIMPDDISGFELTFHIQVLGKYDQIMSPASINCNLVY